jgi:hypothetical protein
MCVTCRRIAPGLVAGLTVLLLAPATGLAAGQVGLRPAAGVPGSTAVLRASGFPASKRIKVSATGLRARSVKTSRTGGFTLRLTVPRRSGWVTITSRGAGRRVASRFFVTSRPGASQVAELAGAGGERLRLSPTALYPGSTLRVQGTGFAHRRTFRLAGFGRALRVRTSRTGAFTAALRLPAVLAAGPRTVSLVGAGLRLAAPMTVSAKAVSQGGPKKPPADPPGGGPPPPPAVVAPAATNAPAISGRATVGASLSASTGAWSGSSASYAYAWERCSAVGAGCQPIAGATATSYTVTAADDGSTLRVVVTAANTAGSASAPSAVTAVVRTPPTVTKSPSIPAKPQEGTAITLTPGTYGGTKPITVTSQWQQCSDVCRSIAGATGASYVVQPGDVGYRLVVVQTATNAAGTVQATSARSQPVTPKPADTSTGLIAHWKMDDTGTTMADSAGTHDGTLHNVTTGVAGVSGTAFGFNGNGYAYVPRSDELSAVDRNVTLTLSFKSPTVSNTGEQDWDLMRSAGGYYDGDEYKIEYNPDGSVLCAFKGSTGYKEVFSAPLTLNAWHKVQCVKTATEVRTVVDGVTTSKAATIGTIVLTKGLIFGAHPSAMETGASEFFRGQLDDASIAIG